MEKADPPSSVDWRPGFRTVLLWNILGLLLGVFGIALFAAIYAATHGGEAGGEVRASALIVFGAVFVSLLPLHEWVHGVAIKRCGARPQYGIGAFFGIFPYLYCTAPGYRFTKRQFAAISAAPAAVISLFGAGLVAFAPWGGWFIVPLGLHLGGCIGDLWMLGLIHHQKSGSTMEDLKTGVRIFSTGDQPGVPPRTDGPSPPEPAPRQGA